MLSSLLVFLLFWFYGFPFICKDFHALLVFLIWLIHIFDYQTICTSRNFKWRAPVFVWVCVPMPCVQLHKYVFCFLGATNKGLKKIQSTYLNNCALTRACIQTHTNPYITHSDRATLNNMHSNPVLASPLLLHSREQMFGDSLQPQRISVYKANSSTQHFWLQREICSWKGEGRPLSQCKVSWGWEERGNKSEMGCMQRWNCVKVVSLLHRKIPSFLRHLVLCVRGASCTVHTVSPRGIMQHQYNQPRWPSYISDCVEALWPLPCSSVTH